MGNGENCKRRTKEGVQSLPCPSPDGCSFAASGACKPYGRLNVCIGDDDPLGSFVFRTTGFNSIRTLVARLQYFQAISGNRLAYLPLELRLRGKSTRQSHGSPIYFVDITLRSTYSIDEALAEARQVEAERQSAGFDQAALESAVRAGLANGAFEDSDDEGNSVVEEFFLPETTDESPGQSRQSIAPETGAGKPGLAGKLEVKAALIEGKANGNS